MIELILSGLSSAVITALLVKENGPFELFRRLRYAAGICVIEDTEDKEHYASHTYVSEPDMNEAKTIYVSDGSLVAEILSCTMCTSFWVSALTVILPFRASALDIWLLPYFYMASVAISAATNTWWYRKD